MTYSVNRLGGNISYFLVKIMDGKQVRYTADYRAIGEEATDAQILYEFITMNGEVSDLYEMGK